MKINGLFCIVFLSFNVAAETIKIGFIDTEEVVNNIPQYQNSINQISSQFESKKQELLDLFEHIELIRADIQNTQESAETAILQNKLAALTSLEKSFEKETEFWQKEINNKKIKLLQNIEHLINKTIKDIALTEEYDLILYENAAFVSDNINITNKVIAEIKKRPL
jgi:outer membrane protein